MDEEIDTVIVDTYAIMADLTEQATQKAVKTLEKIRTGNIRGILHYHIIYELSYHWRKGRLPFTDEEELLDFINTYFTYKDIGIETALEASKIKIVGDNLLASSDDPYLKKRRLSIADATTIALAKQVEIPIVTGDIDLSYVAKKLGVEIIW